MVVTIFGWNFPLNIKDKYVIVLTILINCMDLLIYVNGIEISFTKPLYNVGIYQDQEISKYVTNYDFQMGMKKPIENGIITYKIRESSEIFNTFEAESKLIGDFFYLRIRTKYSANINRETISIYNLTVNGVLENPINGKIITENKTQVIIKVLDKNDNCPLFIKEKFEFIIYDNISLGTQLGGVIATDADEGINSEIFYYSDIGSLQSELKKFPFSINPFSGVIFPTQTLYEFVGNRLVGKVSAIHRGDLSLITCDTISHAQIAINIVAENLFAPNISIKYLKKYFDPILDDFPYAELTISDYDDRHRSMRHPYIVFVKSSSHSVVHISLVPTGKINNYLVKLRSLTNKSLPETITFTIEARDLASRPKSSEIQLSILLSQFKDINLLRVPSIVSVSVPENAIVNSTIILLRSLINCTNADSLLKLQFSWIPDADGAILFGDLAVSSSGIVSVNREFNAEDYGSRQRKLTIAVFMENNENEKEMFMVRIFIDDVNEFPPVVNNNGSTVFVKENTDLDETVFRIDAYDPDISRTSLTYYLFNEEDLPFRLSETSRNVVVVKDNLDAETMQRKFDIRVLITDSGAPIPRSVIAHYEVELVDENEYKPEFVYQYCNLIISRDTPYDNSLGNFMAEDLDRDWRNKVRISIATVSIQEPCFSINSETGSLVLLCSLRNRVLNKIHNFSIQLQANDSLFLSPKLTLNLTIVNRDFPLLQGRHVYQQCNKNNIYARMKENFEQLDKRNRKMRRNKISNNNNNNRDMVQLSQSGSRKRPTFVTNLDKNIHLREELQRGYVVQTIIMEIAEKGRDPYESQFVFGIWTEQPQLVFAIKQFRPNSAQIIVADRLDRETMNKYSITVAVCDQGTPKYCTFEDMQIQVEDINDNKPRFTDAFILPLELPENFEVNKKIVQIQATDIDYSKAITYRLINFRTVFRVHKRHGWLRLRTRLDREQLDKYQLIITASDHSINSRSLTSTVTLNIIITDVNDNKPIFAKSSYSLTLPEDLPIGSFLVQLHATDPDIGINGQLNYAIHGIHADCFKCDILTGTVHLLCKLSSTTEYRLIAVVKDNGKPQSLSSQADLKVYTQRIQMNRYPAILKEPLIYASIRENSAPGTLVTSITPEKSDKSQQNYVYTMSGLSTGISVFQITNEGEIRSVSNIDRERQQFYWLYVYIEDRNDIVVHKILAEIYIEVLNENDNHPMPNKAFYEVDVVENLHGIQPLITVFATDKDVTNTTIFKYKIISGDPMGYFSISPTGQISTTERSIDRESIHTLKSSRTFTDFYDLKVMISDSGIPERINTVSIHMNIKDINDNAPSFINNNKFIFNRYISPQSIDVHRLKRQNIFIGRVTAVDIDNDLNATVRYTLLTPRSAAIYPSNNQSIIDLFLLDDKTGRLYANISATIFDNWFNDSSWSHVFMIKVWAFDLGVPTLWSIQPASVKVRLYRSTNETLKISSKTKADLYLAYQLPDSISTLYDESIGYELLPIPVVDPLDRRGTSLEVSINDPNGPFSIIWAQRDSETRYENEAMLVISETLINQAEKSTLKIIIRNGQSFVEHNLTIHIQFFNKNSPVFPKFNHIPQTITIEDHIKVPTVIYNARALVIVPEFLGLSNSSQISPISSSTDNTELLTYTITASNDQASVDKLFYLHANNGQLNLVGAVNTYRNQTFEIIIEARNKRATYMKLNIHISDTNNMSPQFLVSRDKCIQYMQLLSKLVKRQSPLLSENDKSLSRYHLDNSLIVSFSWIDGSSVVGTLLTSVSASDQDAGLNGELVYSITNNSVETQYFHIDPTNGDIRTNRSLLPIVNRIVFLIVIVTDKGDPARSNKSVVVSEIRDNIYFQNQPQFEKSDLDLIVMENTSVNSILHCLKLRFSGSPSTAAQFIVKSIKPSYGKWFSVTRSTGCIVTVSNLDREIVQDVVTMEVLVQSYNGIVSKYNSVILIKIHIADINDNCPRFLGPLKIQGIISESAYPGSLVFMTKEIESISSLKALVILAEDPDEGINGQIDFIIQSEEASYFKIDRHTGVLSLKSRIDREVVGNSISMSVELRDRGIPQLRSLDRLEITIYIKDENDSPPKFEKDFYFQNLVLPTYANAPLVQLRAVDLDLESKIFYSIIDGNNERFFSLNPESGWLTVSNDRVPIFKQLSSVFLINVRASDGKYETKCNITIYLYDDTLTRPLPLERTSMTWSVPENKITVPHLILPRTKLSYFHNQSPTIRYVLLSDHPSVSVDQTAGSLKLNRPLDREKQPYFLLLVLARGWDGSYGYINVTVNVTDENDYKPLFLSDHYEFLVHINTSIGIQSTKVKAIDLDAGENGSVEYSIYYVKPYTYDLKFTIDSSSGVITVQEGPSDNLLGKKFTIGVKANDKGQPSLSSFTNILVDVVSDKSPLFEQSNYSVVIAEDSVKDRVVTIVRAVSSTGHTILYTITNGNDDELFDLDFATGVIRLVGTLDYESKTHHELVIFATDPSSSLSHSTTVFITVQDCRDERPIFSKNSYYLSVSENVPINHEIITVSVLPQKNIINNKVYYTLRNIDDLSKSCSSDYFNINQTTGVISTNKILDYEICTIHEFWIEAKYDGGFFQTSRLIMQVNILDENDNPPKFIQPSFNTTISQESLPNSLVMIAMATDVDSHSKLLYKLLNKNYNIFRIDQNTGFIYFNPRPDFKSYLPISGIIKLTVLVHDTVHSAITNVSVHLVSTRNHAPFFNVKQIHMVVQENVTISTKVGKLIATDADKNDFGILYYRIVGGFESQHFDLNSRTGELIIKEKLDREIRSRFELRVVVSDGGSKHDFADVLIHITDINDNIPIFDQAFYEATVVLDPSQLPKSSQSILQLHARDKDQSPRYRMDYQLIRTTNNDSPVTLDAITGQMSLRIPWIIPPSHKLTNLTNKNPNTEVYHLVVQVCEEPILSYRLAVNTGSCSDHINVTINIFYQALSQNPVITCSIQSLAENNVVLQVVAVCRISPNNIKGKWALVPSNAPNDIHKDFEIDPNYGFIKAKKMMDYEYLSQYRINVEFRVHGSPLMTTRSIVIDLTDVNDCYPIFDNSRYSISISEDIPVGAKVIQCKAIDLDYEGKDKIIYSIIQANSTNSETNFRIDDNGWIYVVSTLDYETMRSIYLIISASDKYGHRTNTSLTISIFDVNDEIPYWVKNPAWDEIEILEICDNCPNDLPTLLYRLDARDNDTESQTEPLTYLIMNQNSNPFFAYFRISVNGEIILTQPLDAEKITEPLELKILASDKLHWSKEQFTLIIKVLDINDHSPICPQVPDLSISEGIQPGSLITELKAFDRDSSSKFNKLTYKMVECSDPFLLLVEPISGKIIINAPLDREFKEVINFIVQAADVEGKKCVFKVKIIVLDINDNIPIFTNTKIAPLLENAPLGSVVGKIHAIDSDAGINRKVKYRILKDSKSSFSIDKQSGIVRVAGLLDREKKAEHHIVVEASDSGKPSRSSKVKVTILLLDVNDSPPQFLNSPIRINVSEATPVNTLLTTVKAISDDVGINAIVSYRIVMDMDQFRLNSTSGDLVLIKQLDYERNREFFLKIEASDKGYPSLSTTTVVTIQVTDINDNIPIFPNQPYLFTIIENSQIEKLVGKITALDADMDMNSKIIYSLSNWLPEQKWNNRSLFNHIDQFFYLNRETGEIFLKFIPDREEQSIYQFQVTATDQGVPPLSSNTYVNLEIEDMNDNPPFLSKTSYRFLIQVDRSGIIPDGELKKSGDMFEVGRLPISDKDGLANSRPFLCKLVNAESASPFSIKTDHNTDECVLLVTGSLYLSVRNLVVQVNDNGLITLYSRVRVIIDIIRLSNIPPEIEPLNASYVYYHTSDYIKKDVEVAKVLVRDRSPAFDMLKFDLIFNDTRKPQNRYLKNLFKIDFFTGIITTDEQLDSGTYSLDVRVTNGSLSAEKTIFIKIVALTKEMVESACVIQISTMKPNIFLARRLDLKLIHFLKTAMASKLAYIISVKSGTRRRNSRMKRQLAPDDIIDVLVAIYNENENRFFKSSALVSRITALIPDLTNVLEASSVRIFDNVCTDRHICVQGQCQTSIMVNPKQPQNQFQVHGVTFSSLDFSYESSCKCIKYFGGNRCEIPLNKCAHKPCGTVRVCRPEPMISPGFVCDCPALKSGKYCENVIDIKSNSSCLDEQCIVTRESEPIHFTGGGYLKWNIGGKSQPLRIDIGFGFRVLQKPGPLMEIKWNSIRSILIDINNEGKVLITADHITIPPLYVYESRDIVADGKWHNMRLSIVGVANIPGWWLHLVLDGLRPQLLSLESWIEGDSFNQTILLGARNLISSGRISRYDKRQILNESITGCIENVVLNGQRLPYQQLPTSFPISSIHVQSKNLNYGCSESLLKSACSTGVCKNGGLCLIRTLNDDSKQSYVCQCQEMYTGKHCEIFNSPCRFSPCYHGGQCIEIVDGYKCACPQGLFGPQCQWGKACSSILNPCPQMASCLEQKITYQFSNAICRCPNTFQGYLCQVDVDECQIRPPLCQLGRGICHNTHGGYQCNCSLGYGGRHCEMDSLLTIHPDTSSLGLSQYHIYIIVGVLACLFVLALLTVVVLVLRMKPMNSMNSRKKKDRNTALSLDPLYQYNVYNGDPCSRYSPASSMMASSIHHPPGYVGGFMVEPPSTPGGRSQMSFHQAPPSHYGHLSQDAIDLVSLCSSNNEKKESNGPMPLPLNHNSRYIRSSRGQIYLNPAESRQRLSQHSSTFSLVPCNVGPQQHLHLVPNRNSVVFCPGTNHPRLVYDPMLVRNSNLSLHSSHAASGQWEPNDNRLDESSIGMMQNGCPSINQSSSGHDATPVNGEIDHSMMSWNGQYGEDAMFHREMISSQEMSLTDTTDRSSAHLLPKFTPNRINFKMQPPVIHQINISKPTLLTNQNGHSDSPNTVSPSSASIPSGTSSDTKGTAPECEPRGLKKKNSKISPDSNSGEGTECDTEDLEMDHQLICPAVFPSNKHLQEDVEDGLSSVPLLDSIN